MISEEISEPRRPAEGHIDAGLRDPTQHLAELLITEAAAGMLHDEPTLRCALQSGKSGPARFGSEIDTGEGCGFPQLRHDLSHPC